MTTHMMAIQAALAASDGPRSVMDIAKETQIEVISDNLGQVIGIVALSILAASSGKIKAWWKDRHVKKFEKKIIENIKVRDFLAELRAVYSADRVYLMQLHNGTYFLSGESAMKCSMTHVVLSEGVALPADDLHRMQDIPTSCYASCLQKMKGDGAFFSNPSHPPEDSFLRERFILYGTKSAWYAPVRDIRGNWISFVAIEWLDGVGHPNDVILMDYCARIGAQLSKV